MRWGRVKKFSLAVFVLLAVILMGGCMGNLNAKDDNPPINPKPLAQEVLENQTKEVSLYFLNDKSNSLTMEKRFIPKDADVLKQVVLELIKGPNEEYSRPIFPAGTKLLSIDMQEGTVFVNFSKEFLQEGDDEKIDKLRVAALVNALTDIPGVNSVQILVEGNKVEQVGKCKIGLEPLKRIMVVGDVYYNPEKIKRLQERADFGKEAWRFDPLQVLRKEGGIIGLGEQDEIALKEEFSGKAVAEVVHDGKVYKVELIQPFGKGSNYIWLIHKVTPLFTPIPDTDPTKGETFIYGKVKAIDYEARVITIEREYQDARDLKNEVGPEIKVLPNAIIHFLAKVSYTPDSGVKYAEKDISLNRIKVGDELGIILTKDKEARAIIVSDPSLIPYEPNIKVLSPARNEAVSSPFKVIGKARVFEGGVNIRLIDNSGNVLNETFVQASNSAPSWGDFEAIVSYKPLKEPRNGLLQVFSISPQDGSIQNLVSIPLRLK
jgi:hypothetical protein